MRQLDSDYFMDTMHQPSRVFTKAFNDHFIDQMDDVFFEELKSVQQSAIQGKFHPRNKDLLIQWKELYPIRFQHFYDRLSEKSQYKMRHFLDLNDINI